MKSKTAFFMGAGLTHDLDMPTTDDQDKLFRSLFFSENEQELLADKSVTRFLEDSEAQTLYRLFDEKKSRPDYDFLGLREYIRYFFTRDSYNVTAMYNLIDMQLRMGESYCMGADDKKRIVRTEEIARYRRGMLVFLQFVFSCCQREALKNKKAKEYIHFFRSVAERVLQEKKNMLAAMPEGEVDLTSRDFIFSDISYITTNWDVLFLWLMFQAHKSLNDENRDYVVVNGHNLKLKIFNDFATFMAAKPIGPAKSQRLWYPYNESVAVHINDAEHLHDRCVTLIRTLLPHGQTNWLECPVCGKFSMYLGDSWEADSQSLPMLPPWEDGSRYTCLHCHAPLTTADSSMLLQTVIKNKASYIEDIQQDMRLHIQQAERLIFIGYSLPLDDMENRAMFSWKSAGKHSKKIFVVLFEKGQKNEWLPADKVIRQLGEDNTTAQSIKRFTELFGKENVQVNLAGFPNAADEILKIL